MTNETCYNVNDKELVLHRKEIRCWSILESDRLYYYNNYDFHYHALVIYIEEFVYYKLNTQCHNNIYFLDDIN